MKLRGMGFPLAVCMSFAAVATLAAADVSTVKAPETAYRPQVAVDDEGTLHVVHALAGKEQRGELRYVYRKAGQNEFSKPIKVNSTPGCAAAFNMAVGKNGRVHVLIRPTARYSLEKLKRKPKFYDLKYMLYCRLNDDGTAFERERDLSGETFGFEGVGTVIANRQGEVFAYWHGLTKPGPEDTRRIFMVRSEDEGKTFSEPAPIEADVIGACACCSMQGTTDAGGILYLALRNSLQGGSKNSYLLTSADAERTFGARLLGRWPAAGCPGSTYSLTTGPQGVSVAWENQGKVFFSTGAGPVIAAPSKGKRARGPIVVSNSRGDVLFAWSEAKDARHFAMGGDLAWRVYGPDGKPLTEKQTRSRAVARWSTPAAYAEPAGDFVILYDGPGSTE